MIKRILHRANALQSSYALALFRIAFGIILLWESIYFFRIGLIPNFILGPKTLFNYDFLPLEPFSEPILQLLLSGLLISSILIASGILTRWAFLYFGLVLAYFLLLDKGIYNNHLYLISLFCILLSFCDSDASLSFRKLHSYGKIPQWQYFILQLQLAVVFFFGGIAKINPFWIKMHPVREILEIRARESGFEFLTNEVFEYLIMTGGLVFDLAVPFLLWYRKTRLAAIILALFFNISNAWIFRDINIFPFMMIASLVLFMNPSKVHHFLDKFIGTQNLIKVRYLNLQKAGLFLLSFYFLIQFYLPLRHFLYPGYVDWTGEGQHFAWRMKIQNRDIKEMAFALFDLDKREIHRIDPRNFLNRSQYEQMSLHPRMLIQFAEYLKDVAKTKMNISRSVVKCRVKVRFNGSEPEYIFDPDADLLHSYRKHKSFNEWINPLPEPGNY